MRFGLENFGPLQPVYVNKSCGSVVQPFYHIRNLKFVEFPKTPQRYMLALKTCLQFPSRTCPQRTLDGPDKNSMSVYSICSKNRTYRHTCISMYTFMIMKNRKAHPAPPPTKTVYISFLGDPPGNPRLQHSKCIINRGVLNPCVHPQS